MVAVLPLLLRLVGRVGLAAVGVSLPGFFRVLRYEVAPVVVGIEVMAQDPAAVVAAGGQLLHLISGIVFLVGADAVGQVHCRRAVQGVVLVGGCFAFSARDLYQVVVEVVLVGHLCAVRVGDAAQVVGTVVGVAHGIAAALPVGVAGAGDGCPVPLFRGPVGGDGCDPPQGVIGVLRVAGAVLHGGTLRQGVIGVVYRFFALLSCGIRVGLLHQGVEFVVVIGNGVAAGRGVGGQPGGGVIGHGLPAACGIGDAGQVVLQVVGVGGAPAQVVRHCGQVAHHVPVVVRGAPHGVRQGGEAVRQVVGVFRHQAVRGGAGQDVPVGIVGIRLLEARLLRL